MNLETALFVGQVYLCLGAAYWILVMFMNGKEWIQSHIEDFIPSLLADIVTLAEVSILWPKYVYIDFTGKEEEEEEPKE